jgi:hypothetical protein
MRYAASALIALLLSPSAFGGYPIPYSLGGVCKETTHIAEVEVVRVDREKNVITFKVTRGLKGKHPEGEFTQALGKERPLERDTQVVLAWVAPGKKAVLFHNGSGSVTYIGGQWYQSFLVGGVWKMAVLEDYLLWTYSGDVEKLGPAVASLLQGEEVVVPCVAGTLQELREGKGKPQQMRASLKRLDYNPKRDVVTPESGGNR